MTNWDAVLVDAVNRVWSGYLTSEGFRLVAVEHGVIELQRDGVLLTLSLYFDYPGTSPRGLSVGVGIRDEYGRADTVGLWSAIPPDHPAQKHFLGDCATEAELDAVLGRLRDNVLPVFAAPLWRDRGLIEDLLDRQRAAWDEEHQRQLDQRHLDQARAAFKEGRFQAAIDHYALAGHGLTAADKKRLHIARRETGPTER
ncbi:MAG TPA: hypothetical protein VNA20_16045 [Frankiaceae bacterium]|nr:hypothetical protein [Frankiaceae bacterium]